jgi:hypothetical protein
MEKRFIHALMLLYAAPTAHLQQLAVHVSPLGDDANSGRTESQPLRSLAAARDAARQLQSQRRPNDIVTVHLSRGAHRLLEPLVLTPLDSHTEWVGCEEEEEEGTSPPASRVSSWISGGWSVPEACWQSVDLASVTHRRSSPADSILNINSKGVPMVLACDVEGFWKSEKHTFPLPEFRTLRVGDRLMRSATFPPTDVMHQSGWLVVRDSRLIAHNSRGYAGGDGTWRIDLMRFDGDDVPYWITQGPGGDHASERNSSDPVPAWRVLVQPRNRWGSFFTHMRPVRNGFFDIECPRNVESTLSNTAQSLGRIANTRGFVRGCSSYDAAVRQGARFVAHRNDGTVFESRLTVTLSMCRVRIIGHVEALRQGTWAMQRNTTVLGGTDHARQFITRRLSNGCLCYREHLICLFGLPIQTNFVCRQSPCRFSIEPWQFRAIFQGWKEAIFQAACHYGFSCSLRFFTRHPPQVSPGNLAHSDWFYRC